MHSCHQSSSDSNRNDLSRLVNVGGKHRLRRCSARAARAPTASESNHSVIALVSARQCFLSSMGPIRFRNSEEPSVEKLRPSSNFAAVPLRTSSVLTDASALVVARERIKSSGVTKLLDQVHNVSCRGRLEPSDHQYSQRSKDMSQADQYEASSSAQLRGFVHENRPHANR